MRVDSIKRGVDDIWTGAYHSFLKIKKKMHGIKDKINVYYAWGLNNYGQLGIGGVENTTCPTEIVELRAKNIIEIVGGEHHSLALTDEGEVISWGRNDDGQLGHGSDWADRFADVIERQFVIEK